MAAPDSLSGNIEVRTELRPFQTDLRSFQPAKSAASLPLSFSPAAVRDWWVARRQNVRPWAEFFNWPRLVLPKSPAQLSGRVVKNVNHFMSNYLGVSVFLVVFCILTSPLLIVAIGVCAAATFLGRDKVQDGARKFLGRELTVAQQYGACAVASVPVLWLAGAGAAVFWIVVLSLASVLMHAGLYRPMDEADDFELNMEMI